MDTQVKEQPALHRNTFPLLSLENFRQGEWKCEFDLVYHLIKVTICFQELFWIDCYF